MNRSGCAPYSSRGGIPCLIPLLVAVVFAVGCSCVPPIPDGQAPGTSTGDSEPTDTPGDSTSPNDPADSESPDDTDTPAGGSGTGAIDPAEDGLGCVACHSAPRGDCRAVVDSSGRSGHLGVMTDASCALCHEMSEHREGIVRLWGDVSEKTSVLVVSEDPAMFGGLSSFCENCHASSDYGAHAPAGDWTPSCAVCHDVHASDEETRALVRTSIFSQPLGAFRPVVFTALTGTGSFSDGEGENDGVCQVCHVATAYHRYDGGGAPHSEGSNCVTCHPHSASFVPTAGSCIGCHSSAQGSRPAVVEADGGGGHHLDDVVLSDDDCTLCHEMGRHQQGHVRVWSDPTDPTTALEVGGDPAELVPFCGACHDSATHPTIHATGGVWEPACTECHELHDPANANLSLVRDVIYNETLSQDMPVVFTARSGANSFSDGDPTAIDGVCQVCHTATTSHLYDGSGLSHQSGDDCATCHPHSDGFAATGGSCIGCHSLAQGTRAAVVNPDGSGGHQLGGGLLGDDDCEVCHEMAEHQRGQVRLWADPTAPAAVLTPTGDPAELVSFCAACHDAATHPTIHTTGGGWEPVCTECHELHDPASTNLSLVRDSIHNETLSQDMPVVFTAQIGAGSFDDGDPADNDGVCQVCHTTTAYHRYDGSGAAHSAGTQCTGCHPHSDGLQPSAGLCIACHSVPQGGRPAVVNADGSGGHGLGGGVMTNDDCIVCHEMSQHQAGQVRVWADPTNPAAVLALTGDHDELVPFCSACHDPASHPTTHTTGAAWEPACTACHELHDPASTNLSLVRDVVHNETLSVDKPVVFTALTGAGSFDDGDPAVNDGICQVCHTATRYHRHDGSGTSHQNGTDCTTCHPHDGGFIPPGGTSCIGCHSVVQGGRPAVVNADGTGGHDLTGGVLSDDDCAVCHEMSQHQAGQVRVWEDPTAPAAVLGLTGDHAELVPFCTACHDPATHPTTHTTGDAWEPACTECHELHDPASVNLSLVRDVVHNETLSVDKPVVFTALTGAGSFDDGDPAVDDGICQVCHTATAYHVQDGSGAEHEDGTDCTTCHPHDAGFMPTSGPCDACHDTPQDNGDGTPVGGRRAVIADFGRSSHHIVGAVQNEDCVICHDNSQHMQGHVRLIDPDDGGVVYDYDTATAEELGSFCLNCHDVDGAAAGAGTEPFSDGVTVPNIKLGGLWSAAAHSTGGATGIGLTCADCHGNGHGSNLLNLLLPWDGDAGVDNVNEEEGFCYGCHGTGGLSNETISNGWFGGSYENFGDDIEEAFGMASAHPVNDSDAGHVFDLGGGPQELECTSCHGVHQNTGKYWAAPAGATPVDLFGTGDLWGDDAGEKIGQFDPTKLYQAPYIGEAGNDLAGDPLPIDGGGGSLLTDTVLPDYNTLCLQCHQASVGGLRAINWTTRKHGSAAAEPLGAAGEDLALPYDSGNRGQYVVACVDCHEAHGSENVWLIRRSANGVVVPDVLTGASNIEWSGVCDQCHDSNPQSRHHNPDVRSKLGNPPCETCHDPMPFANCTKAGCHAHDDWF